MSEDYLPSDVADRATADHNEASWNYLHTNDFGPDVPYNDAYGFGTGQDLANVELAGGIGQATMYGGTPQGTATPVPQYSSNGYLQTNFPENNSFGHVQAQEGTSNAADQYPSDEDQIWRDHEALSNFQNMAGGNGQEQFLNDFNTEPWNTFQPLAGSEGFPEPAHPVYYEPNMHRNFNNTLNPSPARVDSGQPRTINRPEMTSAHGNATMSSGRPRGPTPAKSNSLGKTPHHSRFGNMQGASGDRYPPARAVAENYAATHNGNIDESDDENQGNEEDEDSEEGDVPNYVTFETYEENDPMIVQNPLQDGRGRTGTRNGHQVWFNPRSSKWRKLQLLYPI